MVRRVRPGVVAAVLVALLALFSISLTASRDALAASPGIAADVSTDAPEDIWSYVDADGETVVHLWFGFSSACPHCRAALPFVERLDDESWLEVHWLQVDGPDAASAVANLEMLAELVHERWQAVPTFLYGGRIIVGWDDADTTGARLRAGLAAYRDELLEGRWTGALPAPADTTVAVPFGGDLVATSLSLPILAVVLGGLDAVNPCALAVLLFLLSILAGSRDRKRMLLIGVLFVAVSGIVYFALMAAWLNVFVIVGALRWVTLVAGVAAVVVAFINLKDHLWFRRGVSLTMPESAKPLVFGRIIEISDETRLRVLVGTTILVAAVANMYEMLCTGGFPVVFTRVLTLDELPSAAHYAYIGLYCLVYVLPALLIVLAFTLTLGARGVSAREARDLKLLSGLLMLGFGGLLLFAADRLSDLEVTVGLFAAAITTWLILIAVERSVERRHPVHHGT